MQLPCGLHNLQPLAGGCVVTIGNFDGIHLGHQIILARLRERSLKLGIPSYTMILESQSREFFSLDSASVCLTRLRKKLELLRGQGVDMVLCLAFNRRLWELSTAEFVHQVLVDGLAVQHLEVGDDFRFGCDHSGDFAFLVNASCEQGFIVKAAATVEPDGVWVSNTWARQALAEGDLHLAERLLGCPFSLNGRVLHRQKLGRQLGLPTANIQLKRRKVSLNGVYLVNTLADSQRRQGVVNTGARPSASGDGRPRLEVHLLDFAGDLYGRHLQVIFHQKLRDEQRFASLEVLKAVILVDIAATRAYWLGQPLD